jgi:hypothetical protein
LYNIFNILEVNMNYNEEMEKELKELGLEGHIVPIKDEDKGKVEDYAKLDIQEKIIDYKNTSMLRESIRNAEFGLPCGSTSEKSLKLINNKKC